MRQDIAEAIRLMKLLNNTGAAVMKKYNVRGATDITGYGLAGHALKMARASNVTLNLNMKNVPLIGEHITLLMKGAYPELHSGIWNMLKKILILQGRQIITLR